MTTAEAVDFWIQLSAHIMTVAGFPAAVGSYLYKSWREQRDREHGTYSSLDDKYMDYLKLCIERPALGMFHPVEKVRSDYSEDEKVQRYAMFEILISIFERAYLIMYDDHASKARARQWDGWETYLRSWKKHPDFPELWKKLGNGFDSNFVAYVNGLKAA